MRNALDLLFPSLERLSAFESPGRSGWSPARNGPDVVVGEGETHYGILSTAEGHWGLGQTGVMLFEDGDAVVSDNRPLPDGGYPTHRQLYGYRPDAVGHPAIYEFGYRTSGPGGTIWLYPHTEKRLCRLRDALKSLIGRYGITSDTLVRSNTTRDVLFRLGDIGDSECDKGVALASPDEVVLYHVTTEEKADDILERGFVAGSVSSETASSGYGEMSDEELARDVFNDYLRLTRRRLSEDYPTHDTAVFFWSDLDKARDVRRTMYEKALADYVIIAVDASAVPCDCYQAEYDLAEDLFGLISDDVDDYAQIMNEGPVGDEQEELDERAFADARRYYDAMRPFDGEPDSSVEVICGCDIPVDAIIGLVRDDATMTREEFMEELWSSPGGGATVSLEVVDPESRDIVKMTLKDVFEIRRSSSGVLFNSTSGGSVIFDDADILNCRVSGDVNLEFGIK